MNTKCYIVTIDKREGDGDFLGPYLSKESAIGGLRRYVERNYTPSGVISLNKAYGGNIEDGCFYSEDETIQLIERELFD